MSGQGNYFLKYLLQYTYHQMRPHYRLALALAGFLLLASVPMTTRADTTTTDFVHISPDGDASQRIDRWEQEAIMRDSFAQDYLREFPESSLHHVRMVKVTAFMQATHDLDNAIASMHREGKNWKHSIEGHSMSFPDKVLKLSEMADDPRVDVICEIGFNVGYSAAIFLQSNPSAKLISFDFMKNHYSTAAASAFHKVFPERSVTIIAGNSVHTVPKTTEILGRTCNLIFIDGGHTREILEADLMHMAALVNTTYHRVVVRFAKNSAPVVKHSLTHTRFTFHTVVLSFPRLTTSKTRSCRQCGTNSWLSGPGQTPTDRGPPEAAAVASVCRKSRWWTLTRTRATARCRWTVPGGTSS